MVTAIRDGIAVVLVTRNGVGHLGEQLKSIVGQYVTPDEVFLVDDDSDDGSKEFVVDFFDRTTRIPVTVVPAPARSTDLYTRIAANFSAGLVAASGYRFIALADQDDVWMPDRLARQRTRLEASGALVTAGNGALIDGDGVPTGQTLRDRFLVLPEWDQAAPTVRLRSVLQESMATGAAMMIDSRILAVGLPIPAGWLHDRWLSIVAVAEGALDVDRSTVVQYRVYPEQVVGLSGRNGMSGWQRIRSGSGKPLLTMRKVRDLSFVLRNKLSDNAIRSELSVPSVLGIYLGAARNGRR